jgi:hypothetical protein
VAKYFVTEFTEKDQDDVFPQLKPLEQATVLRRMIAADESADRAKELWGLVQEGSDPAGVFAGIGKTGQGSLFAKLDNDDQEGLFGKLGVDGRAGALTGDLEVDMKVELFKTVEDTTEQDQIFGKLDVDSQVVVLKGVDTTERQVSLFSMAAEKGHLLSQLGDLELAGQLFKDANEAHQLSLFPILSEEVCEKVKTIVPKTRWIALQREKARKVGMLCKRTGGGIRVDACDGESWSRQTRTESFSHACIHMPFFAVFAVHAFSCLLFSLHAVGGVSRSW